MAKGNIFMGTLKGRVGDQVFYVKQGEQNVIKHQTEITNPKTSAQCIQRSKFSAAGKFFTHGTQALFKFAFESKGKAVSDFNAFMKENVDYAMPMSKYAIDNPQYPMVNEWLMTKGSLTSLSYNVYIQSRDNSLQTIIPRINTNITTISTVAELANAVIDNVYIKENDIITFVLIHSYVDAQSYPAINPNILLEPQIAWNIVQVRLSSVDTSTLASIGLTATISETDIVVKYTKKYDNFKTSYVGGTAILSRNTPSGLKVSTNRLSVVQNNIYQQPLEYVRQYVQTDEYLNAMIPTWQDNPSLANSTDIVLEGALVSKSSVSQTGNNPIKQAANHSQATKFTIPFDPRKGYFVVTLGEISREDAIQAAERGELVRCYYNRASGVFYYWGRLEDDLYFAVDDNGNGTWSISQIGENELFIYIHSWVNEFGQTIEFSPS